MTHTAAQAKAVELMAQFGLTAQGWRFAWDRAARRFGCCKYSTRTISLSARLVVLNTDANVENTIRHEIAHALAGHKAGHGPAWKAMAVRCGARPERCATAKEGAVALDGQFVGTCPKCAKTVRRHRVHQGLACIACCNLYNGGRYSADYAFRWTRAQASSSKAA